MLVVRTFSKIYGLAGLRIGYGVGPEALVRELGKVRRAFDMSTTSQEAALASLDDAAEIERRRLATAEARAELSEHPRAGTASIPSARPSANFLYVETGDGTRGRCSRPAARGRDRPAADGLRRAGRDPRSRRGPPRTTPFSTGPFRPSSAAAAQR